MKIVGMQYRLIRSDKRRKTLSLIVQQDGTLVVRAPSRTPAAEIDAFFRSKRPWIEARLRQMEDVPPDLSHHPGEGLRPSLPFLGRTFPLVLVDPRTPGTPPCFVFSLREDGFALNRDLQRHGRTIIEAWYRREAAAYLPSRVARFSAPWGLTAAGVRISGARHRWGSCSFHNTLSFAWRLVMAPPEVIDYVVVHELAHIREKNHGRGFWRMVEAMMPDYAAHRSWLKEKGSLLNL
jgi:predicted metal-dependent hydrolase